MLAIQAEEGEGLGHPSKPHPSSSTSQPTHEEPILNVVSLSHQKTQTPRQALNKVIKLPQTSEPILNVPDEAVYEEWDDRVERATTTATSLDAEQASGNINKTQSTTIPNVPLPQGIGAGGSPRCQEAMGGSIAQTRSERVPTPPYDSPLLRVNTLGSDEGSMTLQELMVLCTTLSKKVESLEADLKQTKQVYGAAYTKLIMKGRMIEEIDQDAGVTLVTPTQGEDQPEDQLGVLSAAKILADAAKTNVHTYTRRRRAVSTSSGGISTANRMFSTAEESVSTAGMVQKVNINIPSPVVIKDKGKCKMEESEDEQIKRTKLQQEQDRLGHEAAVRLQEELDEEERQRMARVHEAAQSFTEEEWENIRARVEADEELTQRLQAEERNKYSKVDQAKMLVDLINQRKRYFAAQKAEAKRNKPMTQAQQRNYMINYIKTWRKGRPSELAARSSQATITDSAEVGSSKRGAEAELVMNRNLVKKIQFNNTADDKKEVRQILGLADYYQRFIKDFSKIAKSLTELTKKNKKYVWGENQESAFQLLKQKLCEAPILALPERNDDFVVYCDESLQGLGAVLMQREKVIAYAP
ncbi:retrovirus-related pol polyprotein from transposon TNT 1-94 [Tanacetum coccineum]